MSISFLSVFSNVQLYCGRLIISFHPSSDLLTTTTSRDRLFSLLVANEAVVHLWRRSILCNFPLQVQWIKSRYMSFAVIHKQSRFKGLHKPRLILCSPYLLLNSFIMFIPASIININNRPMRSRGFAMSLDDYCIDRKLHVHFASYYALHNFIPANSIAPLQVLYYSEALPTTARILYRSFTPKSTGNCR